MLGLSDLKETKVYQEAKEETKAEIIPRLLNLGLTVEQIAAAVDLDLEQVQEFMKNQSNHLSE